MQYKQIKTDFSLNKITHKDQLFAGDYTIDPYQNCEFGCLYCDSSSDKTIFVKSNILEILEKELEKTEKGTIIVGSVNDPYQRAEEKFNLARGILEIIEKHGFPCHILTKSDLVSRDIDVLSRIDNCMVTISLMSLKDSVSNIFEKNVPSPKIRLQTIEKLTSNGIMAGLAILPIFPYIVENELEDIFKSARAHNVQYLLHKHLELKGDQKTCFIDILRGLYPNLVLKYEELYKDSYMPKKDYILKINEIIYNLAKENNIKNRV